MYVYMIVYKKLVSGLSHRRLGVGSILLLDVLLCLLDPPQLQRHFAFTSLTAFPVFCKFCLYLSWRISTSNIAGTVQLHVE